MSLRLEMLQVARLAPKLLSEATPQVIEFLHSQQQSEGSFVDRSGESDLYYTVFGMDGLLALQQPLPVDALQSYLRTFPDPVDLDLVHLACLARCWSVLPTAQQLHAPRDIIQSRLEACRSADGGFGALPGQPAGSLYSTFVAVGAYQDLHIPIPDSTRLTDFIFSLRDPHAGFKQSLELPVSLVPMTAGAVTLLRQLGAPITDPSLQSWLLRCFDPQGGFRPAPAAPLPDLLSTATALHALSTWQIELKGGAEVCLDFLDSLWTNRGGFYGHWEDTHADCEYTFYALLSLGHLSLLS